MQYCFFCLEFSFPCIACVIIIFRFSLIALQLQPSTLSFFQLLNIPVLIPAFFFPFRVHHFLMYYILVIYLYKFYLDSQLTKARDCGLVSCCTLSTCNSVWDIVDNQWLLVEWAWMNELVLSRTQSSFKASNFFFFNLEQWFSNFSMPGGEGKTKISFTKEVQVHNCFKYYVCEDYQKNWCKKWILIDLAGLTRKRERGRTRIIFRRNRDLAGCRWVGFKVISGLI